jgi:hypothetical protein
MTHTQQQQQQQRIVIYNISCYVMKINRVLLFY